MIAAGRAIDPAKHFVVVAEHVRQRAVVVAEQHAAADRPRGVSARHDLRQRRLPAPAGHRASGHRADPARRRLLDGRAAGVSVGRAVSGDGGGDRADLRHRAHFAAQLRVSRRAEGGADRRRRVQRRLVRDAAGERADRLRARLRRLGLLAGLLSRARVHEDGPVVDRRRAAVLRGALPIARRQRSAGDAVDLAARRHQRQPAVQRRPRRRAASDHRRARS